MKNLIIFISLGLLNLASNIAIAQLPDYVPADSLVGWWSFTGNANDLSLNANNGTANGAQLVSDRFGNASSAYDFVNPVDHILVQSVNQVSFEGNFTISAWVNFRNFNADYPHIMSGMNNYIAFHGRGPAYYPNTERAGFYTTSDNGVQQGIIVSQDPISVNAWHCIVINKYGTEVKMYIDNLLSVSGTYENLPLALGEGLYFGNFFLLNNNIDGMVDDIGIWSRSLSQNEMSNLFYMPNTGIGRTTAMESFHIAPNPASDYFILYDIAGITGSKLSVTMYNCSGQVVLKQEINRGNPVIHFSNTLSKGLYSVKINNEEGRTWQQKLLVNF
jgi:hypothetical protein